MWLSRHQIRITGGKWHVMVVRGLDCQVVKTLAGSSWLNVQAASESVDDRLEMAGNYLQLHHMPASNRFRCSKALNDDRKRIDML